METRRILALGRNSSGEQRFRSFFNVLKNIELVSFYGSLVSRNNLLDLHEGVMLLFIWTGADAGVTLRQFVK